MKKYSFLFSLGTLLSRFAGLLRESVLAWVFGAHMDAFIVANRIPNLLREFLAEGALGASFTKVYTQLISSKEEARAQALLMQSLSFFSWLSFGVCFLGIFFSETLVSLFDQDQSIYHDTVLLTRVLFPFLGLMTLGAIASGVLHCENKFFLTALSPVFLNGGYLLGALVFPFFLTFIPWFSTLTKQLGLLGLAIGVSIGGGLQAGILLWAIRKHLKQAVRFLKPQLTPDLKKVLFLMAPMILGSGAGQINVLVNTYFASALGAGAVSWLTYSFRLLQLPIGLFGVAVSTVALPQLTKAMVQGPDYVSKKLAEALKLVLSLTAPCFCLLVVHHQKIIELLYQQGQFDKQATIGTSECLFAYSFGLFGYGLIKVLSSYYYAINRASFAMYWGVLSLMINYVGNSYFGPKYGVQGLAFSASMVLTLNSVFLLGGILWFKPFSVSYRKISFFCIKMGCLCSLAIWLQKVVMIKADRPELSLKVSALWHLGLAGLILVCLFGPMILHRKRQ